MEYPQAFDGFGCLNKYLQLYMYTLWYFMYIASTGPVDDDG